MILTKEQNLMMSMVPKSTLALLQELITLDYAFFATGHYNLNIIGERNPNNSSAVSNSFDDYLHVIYMDANNMWRHDTYNITTEPGKYWMNNPMNKKGTAILVPGQYRGAYAIAKHQGKYEALCQVKGAVTVYRDSNKDEVYDYVPETKDVGFFGINIHRSNPYKVSNYIDKWSAGCQVFANPADFNNFMKTCRLSADIWGNSFTYTLI